MIVNDITKKTISMAATILPFKKKKVIQQRDSLNILVVDLLIETKVLSINKNTTAEIYNYKILKSQNRGIMSKKILVKLINKLN